MEPKLRIQNPGVAKSASRNYPLSRRSSIPARFDSRELGWLIFARVEAVKIAKHHLQWDENRQ
jgi:hypothetical protein